MPEWNDDHIRAVEATLFASESPMSIKDIKLYVGEEVDVMNILRQLQSHYTDRGIELVQRGAKWNFQTAADLGYLLRREKDEIRKISRAAVETLAIIAYHGPVSRAEIESIRGVQISKGTLDVLIQADWVKPAGRREVPGRPLIYITTDGFLAHFGLESRKDLPGIRDLKMSGLLDPVEEVLEQMDLNIDENDDKADHMNEDEDENNGV